MVVVANQFEIADPDRAFQGNAVRKVPYHRVAHGSIGMLDQSGIGGIAFQQRRDVTAVENFVGWTFTTRERQNRGIEIESIDHHIGFHARWNPRPGNEKRHARATLFG